MKLLIGILPTLVVFTSCMAQEEIEKQSGIEWQMDLASPSKDSLDAWCIQDIKNIKRIGKGRENNCDMYYFEDELFSGWACEIIPNHPHRYRYEQFEEGKMISRVSYYDNGQIDGDFRMKECKNYGPSRMWLYDGHLYIDEFYSAPNVKHGIQRQWYDNGVLAKQTEYNHGKLLSEKKYDRTGQIIAL